MLKRLILQSIETGTVTAFVMVLLTTGAVPIGWRIFGWDWAVIVPLA